MPVDELLLNGFSDNVGVDIGLSVSSGPARRYLCFCVFCNNSRKFHELTRDLLRAFLCSLKSGVLANDVGREDVLALSVKRKYR